MLQLPGAWSGGGLVPQRLDRVGLFRRLGERGSPAWIIDELLDSFEIAVTLALGEARKRAAISPTPAADRPPPPTETPD